MYFACTSYYLRTDCWFFFVWSKLEWKNCRGTLYEPVCSSYFNPFQSNFYANFMHFMTGLESLALSVCCVLNREMRETRSCSIAYPTGFGKRMRIAYQVNFEPITLLSKINLKGWTLSFLFILRWMLTNLDLLVCRLSYYFINVLNGLKHDKIKALINWYKDTKIYFCNKFIICWLNMY